MKLKRITAVAIVAFSLVVIYLLVASFVFYHAPAPGAKLSPAALAAELKAIKNGVFASPKPAIIH